MEQHYVLPESVPTALVALALAMAAAGWAWLHKFPRPAGGARRLLLAAASLLAGAATMLAAAQLAQRFLLLTTNWPIWPLAVASAAAVEAVLALYRSERQGLRPGLGRALAALRVAAVLAVGAMLAQPVRMQEHTQELQRVVAVLVDQSDSMRIRDTQYSVSDKVRLAEALWQGPVRSYRLESAAADLADLRARLREQLDALGVFNQARADLRQIQMAAQQPKYQKQLFELNKLLDPPLAAVDAPLKNNAPMADATRLALMDVKTRLSAKAAPALQRALGLADAKLVDQLGANHATIVAALNQAAAELAEVAPRLDACAAGLDESFYAALPADRKMAVEVAAAHPRIEQARQALLLPPPPPKDAKDKPPCLLDRMKSKYVLRLYTFDSSASMVSQGAWSKSPLASMPASAASAPAGGDASQGTDLAAAMHKALSDLGSEKLAGIVIVGDGRHNVRNSIDAALRQVALQQAPVCSVVAGASRPPTDAAVVALDAPETVYARDKMLITAQIKLDGLAGRTARVQLLDGPAVKDTQTITIPADGFRTFVSLADTPDAPGVHSYRVQVDRFEGEAFADNNSYPLTLNVTEDRAKLLLIEERPRWEFRYLKNLFTSRDNSVRLQYVLLSADKIDGIPPAAAVAASASAPPGQVEAYALPANEAEWMKFDVIFLGDVPPSRFSPEQMTCLRKFVADRGGTLVISAGPDFMPQSFASTPLAELLPVRLGGAAPADAPQEPFRIALTEEGAQHVIMRQSMDLSTNSQLWATLPELYWRCPVSGVKGGARVLAYAMPPSPPSYMSAPVPGAASGPGSASALLQAEDTRRLREQFQDTHALIVHHRVAMGQVLFVGTDSTWRMRYRTGDTYHHKFWGQVLRWATTAKLPGESHLVKLGSDRARYSPHSRITARAKIMQADFSPMTAKDVSVRVYSGRQMVLHKALARVYDSPGMYEADLGDLPSGAYRMVLQSPSIKPLLDAEKIKEVATEFSVDPSTPIEQVELSADRGLLGQVASATGGTVAELYEAPRVLAPLGPGTLVTHEVRQYTLWDSAWCLGLIIVLVTVEWLLRKKAGLA